MQEQASPLPEDADAQTEAAVMLLILTEHPINLTVGDIERELAPQGEFAERDAVARAIRELAGVGLLNRHGELVLPSRAALYFDGLDVDKP